MLLINMPIVIPQQNQQQKIISRTHYIPYHQANLNQLNENDQSVIELKRYLVNGLFASKGQFLTEQSFYWSHYFQWNNSNQLQTALEQLNTGKWNQTFLSPNFTKNLQFKKLQGISSITNLRDHENNEYMKIVNQIAVKHQENEKEYLVSENGIHFLSPKTYSNHLQVVNSQIVSKNNIIYNNIILYPQKLQQGIHNKVLFKVAIFNDNEEDIARDIALLPKKVSGLPLKGNSSLDLQFVLNNTSNPETINNQKIIGTIEIISNTFYDMKSQQTIKGLNKNANKGYIIPFNFQGELNYVIETDLNEDFSNLHLGLHQTILQPYLDHYEGIKKLKIIYKNDIDNVFLPYTIKSRDFVKIALQKLSLQTILHLSKKEENENLE
ncbi:hypothetical protein NV226_00820 [Mycoplasma iguanae]|uniref:Transmembrane protein n=2 Tax=Mycoplasma iguanae TaxID=292461 RepID=A0ABY5R947_9MOLU|nr:hypothetical protein [Mycoplasma iguanae]UVD81836.1 hypothetical protein NV226_00820 [Mycoplasma iguanae]